MGSLLPQGRLSVSCLRRGGGVFTTPRWAQCVLFGESGWGIYYPKVGSVCPVWGEGVGSLLPQGGLSVSCLGRGGGVFTTPRLAQCVLFGVAYCPPKYFC